MIWRVYLWVYSVFELGVFSEEGDPWQEALDIASQITTPALVIDTESSTERLGRPLQLAEALAAEYVHLESSQLGEDVLFALQRLPMAHRNKN